MEKIKSIKEYLDIIDNISSTYSKHPMKAELIFRGLCTYEQKLIPGVFRYLKDDISQLYANVSEIEIINHFIKNAMSLVNHIPAEDLLTWLTYAQHFGAPTRLLDFSSNPLVSLYFCCKNHMDRDGAVCILHEKNYVKSLKLNLNPKITKHDVLNKIMNSIQNESCECTKYPVTFIPYYIDARMEAQASRFLVWGCDKSPFETLADPSGNMLNNESGAFFAKIKIDAKSKVKLLYELSFLGINEKKLFPGLDGIGKYISEYYKKY